MCFFDGGGAPPTKCPALLNDILLREALDALLRHVAHDAWRNSIRLPIEAEYAAELLDIEPTVEGVLRRRPA